VTLVRPVGTVPAGPTTSFFGFSRGGAFAAAGVLAALNAQADQIVSTLTWQPALNAAISMAGISAIIWAAMAAAWKIGSEDDRKPKGAMDYAVLGVVLLSSFVPLSYAAQAGLLLCGCYLLATAGRSDAERRSAVILLALTGPLIWGRLILHLFEVPILSLDAHIVGTVIGSPTAGNVVRFAGDNGRFVIAEPCSSVHNMSLAIVLWTTAAMLFRIRIDGRYMLVGAAMVALMYGLNLVRLSTIGLFPGYFDILHVGWGAVTFGYAGLVGAAIVAGFGVIDAAARQR
jgi:exosortase/archaeosortase family protein